MDGKAMQIRSQSHLRIRVPLTLRPTFAVVAILLIVTLSAPAQQPTAPQPGDQARNSGGRLQNVVFNLEHKLATAEKQQDKAFFQRTLDDQLVYVAYDGLVFDKSKLLSSMKYVDVKNYSMENLKVRSLGANAALVTYDLRINAHIAGRELPEKQYAASVWVRDNGQWKLMFHQATPAHHR